MNRWCALVFDMLNTVSTVATSCIKMNWKGLGTTSEISITAKTCVEKANRRLKNEPTMMAKRQTGIMYTSPGANLTKIYEGKMTSSMSVNNKTMFFSCENTL